MHKRWPLVIIAVLAAVAISIGVWVRVCQVNATALSVPAAQTYEMGEAVALDGAYMETDSEATDGYSMTVSNAELMSYNEYVDCYGINKSKRKHITDGDAASVVVLEVAITNDGNKEGCLAVSQWRLVPARANTYCIVDADLWGASEKNAPGEAEAIVLLPDTTYTTRIPFVTNTSSDKKYANAIDDRSFTLYVADAPVRKGIQMTLG